MAKLSLGLGEGQKSKYKRKSMFKKRYSRYPSVSYTRSVVPRTFFSYMPSELRVKLDAQPVTVNTTIANGGEQTFTNFLQSVNLQNLYPQYYRSLMSIYSRSTVMKTKVLVKIQNITAGSLTVLSAVIPANDLNVAANRLASYPNSQQALIGPNTGGHDQYTFTVWTDHVKFIGPSWSDASLSGFSAAPNAGGAPGALTDPQLINALSAPNHSLGMVNNAALGPVIVQIMIEVEYHMMFSARHTGTT